MGSLESVVVIPALNEMAHIGSVTAGFLQDRSVGQVWILDGGSTDGTRDLAARLATHPRVRLIDNPHRTQAAALNLAAHLAGRAGVSVMIRADAHARYPAGYASALVAMLEQTGADSVTVPLIADPAHPGPWQAAATALQRSWIGTGGAAHRRASPSGWVTHGHHAAFRLSRFLDLGGYDTRFHANEDVEFDLRLIRDGGRIWFAGDLAVAYEPRPGPLSGLRQMFRNGRGRMMTARKHPQSLGLRQLLPVAAFAGLALMLASLLLPPPIRGVLAFPGLAYLAVLAAAALHLGRGHPGQTLRSASLLFLTHMGFAAGLLWQGVAGHLAPLRAGLRG